MIVNVIRVQFTIYFLDICQVHYIETRIIISLCFLEQLLFQHTIVRILYLYSVILETFITIRHVSDVFTMHCQYVCLVYDEPLYGHCTGQFSN